MLEKLMVGIVCDFKDDIWLILFERVCIRCCYEGISVDFFLDINFFFRILNCCGRGIGLEYDCESILFFFDGGEWFEEIGEIGRGFIEMVMLGDVCE